MGFQAEGNLHHGGLEDFPEVGDSKGAFEGFPNSHPLFYGEIEGVFPSLITGGYFLKCR